VLQSLKVSFPLTPVPSLGLFPGMVHGEMAMSTGMKMSGEEVAHASHSTLGNVQGCQLGCAQCFQDE